MIKKKILGALMIVGTSFLVLVGCGVNTPEFESSQSSSMPSSSSREGTRTYPSSSAADVYQSSSQPGESSEQLPHYHFYDKKVVEDKYLRSVADCEHASIYYYSCECGEKGTETFEYGEPLGHSFTNYVSDGNATHTTDGTKTAKCDRCDATDTIEDVGSKVPHIFDQQVISEQYLKSEADCTHKAVYYYSCECGEKGTETFEYGEPLGHSFTNYVSDGNATHTTDGTKTAKCDRCDATDTIEDVGSKVPHHTFDQQVISSQYFKSEPSCEHGSIYYCSCECGAKGSNTFEVGEPLGHIQGEAVFENESGSLNHCSRCNKTYYIDKNGTIHNYGELLFSTKMIESFDLLEHGLKMKDYYYDILGNLLNYHFDYENETENRTTIVLDINSVIEVGIVYEANYQQYGISLNEAKACWMAIESDWPMFYWLSNNMAESETSIFFVTESNYFEGQNRKTTNESIINITSWFKNYSESLAGDISVAKYAYDYIIGRTDYAFDENNNPSTELDAHSVAGFFKGKNVVCEGYAKTFQLLMNACGIDNCYIVGKVTGAPDTSGHAWNYVYVSDGWYFLDITWDDYYDHSNYQYFLLEKSAVEEMGRTVFTNDLSGVEPYQYLLPELSSRQLKGLGTLMNSKGFVSYGTLDELLLLMDDENEEYELYLYDFINNISEFGMYEILEKEWPNVKSLTIIGKNSTKLDLPDNVIINSNVTFKNLFLSEKNGDAFDIKNHTVTITASGGEWGYDTTGTESSSIVFEYNVGAMNYDSMIMLGNINIGTIKLFHSDVSFSCDVTCDELYLDGGYFRYEGFNKSKSTYSAIIGKVYLNDNGSVDVTRPYKETHLEIAVEEIVCLSDGYFYFLVSTIDFDDIPMLSIEKYNKKGNVLIYISGSIMFTDSYGNSVKSYVDPYSYKGRIVNIGDLDIDDFKYVFSSGYEQGDSVDSTIFKKDEDNYLVTNVEIDGDYYVSGNRIIKYIGNDLIVNVPEGYTEINYNAFLGKDVVSITLPSTLHKFVEVVEGEGFTSRCPRLLQVVLLSQDIEFEKQDWGNGNIVYVWKNDEMDEFKVLFRKDIFGILGSQAEIYTNETKMNIGVENDFVFYEKDNITTLISAPDDEEIVLPDTLGGNKYRLGERLFSEREKLRRIVISSGVTSIGEYCFYGCSGLNEIIIQDGLTEIGNSAFRSCRNIKNIVFPSTLEKIDPMFFVDSGTVDLSINSQGAKYIVDNKCLIDRETNTLILGTGSSVIPNYVTEIEQWAFSQTVFDGAFVVPSNVKAIGDYAFYWSTITSITLEEGIESIGDYSLSCIQKLSSLILPSTIKKVGKAPFSGCRYLVTFECSVGLEEIDLSTSKVVSVVIPEGTKIISFFDCTKLEEITIPSSVIEFDGCFYNCRSISKVFFNGTIEEWNKLNKPGVMGSDPLFYGAKLYVLVNGEYQLVE